MHRSSAPVGIVGVRRLDEARTRPARKRWKAPPRLLPSSVKWTVTSANPWSWAASRSDRSRSRAVLARYSDSIRRIAVATEGPLASSGRGTAPALPSQPPRAAGRRRCAYATLCSGAQTTKGASTPGRGTVGASGRGKRAGSGASWAQVHCAGPGSLPPPRARLRPTRARAGPSMPYAPRLARARRRPPDHPCLHP